MQESVDVHRCRLVPILTYNVNYNATENLRVFILLLFLILKLHVQSVCKFWGCRQVPYLRGETQIAPSASRRKSRFWDTPQLSHTK